MWACVGPCRAVRPIGVGGQARRPCALPKCSTAIHVFREPRPGLTQDLLRTRFWAKTADRENRCASVEGPPGSLERAGRPSPTLADLVRICCAQHFSSSAPKGPNFSRTTPPALPPWDRGTARTQWRAIFAAHKPGSTWKFIFLESLQVLIGRGHTEVDGESKWVGH